MTGTITLLDQPRTLDALARPTSAIIYFYLTGTTTLANIYSDAGLTTPAANPILLSSGQFFPDIFLNPDISYRRYIQYGDGGIHDIDPLPTGFNAASVIFNQAGAGATERSVESRLRETISVKDFGAIGDGVANDAVAIQAAINSLPTDGGTIRIPRGKYLIGGTTITWPVNKYVELIGDGGPPGGNGTNHTGATEIVYTGTGTAFSLRGTAFDSAQIGGAIRNMSMKGPGIGTTAIAVDLQWSSESSGKFTMSDVYIYNWGKGFRLDACLSLDFFNITTRGCTIGIEINPTVEAVNTCRFYGCNAISCATGVSIYNSANANMFFGGTIEGCPIGAYILGDANAPHQNLFIGCWFEASQVGARGALIYTNPINPDPQGNGFINCLFTSQTIGIELNTCDGTRIEGCRFIDFTAAKVPVRIDPDAVNTIIRDNINFTGNNDYNFTSAGAGWVIEDVVANIRRKRTNNNRQDLIQTSGRYDSDHNGVGMSWRNLGTGTTYASVDSSTADPKLELPNGTDIVLYSGNYTGETFRAGGGTVNTTVSYSVNGTKVVGTRVTGYGVPTGTATRTTFATGSVTLPQLAERVKALIDDLTTHGLIGA